MNLGNYTHSVNPLATTLARGVGYSHRPLQLGRRPAARSAQPGGELNNDELVVYDQAHAVPNFLIVYALD